MTNSHKTYNLKDIELKIEQFCAYQDRCKYDVEQKLKTFNIRSEDVDNIINNLVEQKFLDEIRYVQSYTRGSYRYKKWGWNKIKANLSSKRISNDIIQKGYNEIDLDEYAEMISTELSKKWPTIKGKTEFDKKNKLIRFGISRGYEYDYITSFTDQIPLED